MNVKVVTEINNISLDKPFDYLVPLVYQNNVRVGSRVVIPFGNRNVEGFVVQINNRNLDNLKPIISVYDDYLNEEQLILIQFLRKRNLATMIECINTILPPALRASIKNKEKKKFDKVVRVLNKLGDLNEKEQRIVQEISQKEMLLSVANKCFSPYLITKLRKKGVLEVYLKEGYRNTYQVSKNQMYDSLTNSQANVVNSILTSEFQNHLIFGVTGSGKTVCYIELIKKVLHTNKQVLILVPEISLTPQFINVISHHIDSEIAVFHSKMSSSERYDQYRLVLDQKVSVAIGTRSAVFLPFSKLGLIIIDEEHDNSFIQEQSVSYSAKEVAFVRAKYHNAKVVLGSATPDIVTYHSAINRKICLHVLQNSFSNVLATTKIIDMKSNFDWILSKELLESIKKTLNSSKQFVLILNRRGYSNYLICNSCGQTLKCPHCNVTLTLHNDSTLKCHHCEYVHYDFICECGSSDLKEYGYGIQKVEEILLQEFKDLKIARVDRDITSKISSVEKIFTKFNNQEYHGLIGTQILSKGLNFLNVTLIAVIDADFSLNISTYKASENTFQYINQSIGRNNRGSDIYCENILQTYDTNHYAINYAYKNDYIGFYGDEIVYRRKLNYPPFTKYAKILGTSVNLSELIITMEKIYNLIYSNDLFVTKPHFCSIERIKGQYRMQILLKHSNITQIFGIIETIREINDNKIVKIIINNNPINF